MKSEVSPFRSRRIPFVCPALIGNVPCDLHRVDPVAGLGIPMPEGTQTVVVGEEIIAQIIQVDKTVIGDAVDQILLGDLSAHRLLEDRWNSGMLSFRSPSPTAIGCPP